MLFFVLCPFSWIGASSVSEYDDVEVLKSDQQGIIFKYLVPEFTQSRINFGGEVFDLINIDKCALSILPGRPQIPVRRVVIAVPPEAEISVEILKKEGTELSGVNLAYALKAELDEKSPVGYRLIPSKTKEVLDQYYPPEIVFFDSPTYLRNQRIIELEISPIQYNPARKSARYYSQITVKMRFSGGRSKTFKSENDLFERIYQNVLLNYDDSKGWRKTAEEIGFLKPGVVYPFGYSDNWYKVIVRENGIYKVDRTALIQAGIAVSSLDPKTLRMFSGGGGVLPLDNSNSFQELKEIAIFVSGEEDGVFDSDDFILFFGWSTNDWEYDSTGDVVGFHTNPYTNDNVLWLTFNPTSSYEESPRRMQLKDGSPTEQNPLDKFKSRIHVELDNTLKKDIYGAVLDYFHWFWMETSSARMFVSLPGALVQDTCLIKVRHTDSRASLWVNGKMAQVLDSLSSSSLTVAKSFDLNGGLVDTLDISFPGNVFLDWYEIEYPRQFECHDRQLFFESPETTGVIQFNISNLFSSQVYLFDVTDYFDVKKFKDVQIEGEFARFQDIISTDAKSRYLLVDESRIKKPAGFFRDEKSNLKEVFNRADFLIITHSDFYDQIQSLKSFRESYNQMSVMVVKIQDVYDEFSGGLFDPVAIRDFLKFAYQNWQDPAPAFVLLVGDGNYDYKNNLGAGVQNFIPPFTTDPSISDDIYVLWGDTLNMIISRLPVRSESEAGMVLNKIIDYEGEPEFGTWRNLITLVADDEWKKFLGGELDGLWGHHTPDTETLAKFHVPPSFNVSKIYLMEYPFDYKGEKPEAEEAIIDAFNSGTLMVNFIGHGNPNVWADERVFKRSQDIPRLANKRKLSLVYMASCSIGRFFSPIGEGMAEEFLRAEEKGAIATISATREVFSDPNAELNFKVYDLLLNQDSLSIGEALLIAKLLRQLQFNDRKFVLFGDPVMKLGSPRLKAELTEVYPDTISALGLITIKGEVKNDGGDLITGFDGIAKILAFDSERKRTHTVPTKPQESKVNYDLPGQVMFKGTAEVKAGKFQASFVVPKDISYGGTNGRISVYLVGQNQDGAGVRDSLVIEGSDTTVIDTIGPGISLSFDERTGFTDGETILPNSVLKLAVFDEHGINITGEVGHGITLAIDRDFQNQIDLTGGFEYDLGSYQKGLVSYGLPDLSEGDHVFTIKAWDNANNSSVVSANVKVSAQRELELTGVMNYPNPFADFTNFYYHLSQDADRVEIKIFTQAGRLIRQIRFASSRTGINFSATWDGKDEEGDEVANGVYIYKITAEGTLRGERKVKEAFGKAVVVR